MTIGHSISVTPHSIINQLSLNHQSIINHNFIIIQSLINPHSIYFQLFYLYKYLHKIQLKERYHREHGISLQPCGNYT